jgi:hypothetical protein
LPCRDHARWFGRPFARLAEDFTDFYADFAQTRIAVSPVAGASERRLNWSGRLERRGVLDHEGLIDAHGFLITDKY